MKDDITLHTRREFLRRTVLGGALSWTVPTFLANTFSALQAESADQATQAATGRDATILVVLQMAGGNDGLNTVVPFTNDFYHRARPRIGLAESKVLRLNTDLGLHAALTGFKDLYDAGQLAVVHGVGYPNPNRSHFRSTEIWQTASDPGKIERYGWLGRYFDNACSGCDPTIGVSIGRQTPQAFVEDMQGQGNLPRVLLMTFSEFGRRVAENANGGTDHGAAAPMFVVGDKVKAGLLGEYPSLAPGDLFQGDLKFKVDFRSVYAGVLEDWLKTRSEPVLGRQFAPVQVV
jgi:uncharacterized protein (DUF1501 family)